MYQVAIIGMGCTPFGVLRDKSGTDLVMEAFQEALQDAGIQTQDIDATWFSTRYKENHAGKRGLPVDMFAKLSHGSVSQAENFCTSGADAFRSACHAVASGACDITLALGVEKFMDVDYGGLSDFGASWETRARILFPDATVPGQYAMMATSYFAKSGLSPEEGKKALARVSFKSLRNGLLNPKAHIRREVTMEEVIHAPIVAWPLGLFDCCGVSEGAACAIICRAAQARDYRKDPVYVKALQAVATAGEEPERPGWDGGAHVETTYQAAIRAYREAGITKPREEINLLELHDCFSITELCTYEDLQISPRGRAVHDLESGFYDLDGRIPCQSDGGIKCFGHPIGASGLRMLYEIYRQLQGRVETKRQIRNPRTGLAHSVEGAPLISVADIVILGNRR